MGDPIGAPDLEITVSEFLRDWRGGDVRVIDVREREEWDEGRMGGARLIPLGELADRLGELDRSLPTVIVCRSGRRSLVAAEFLRDRGFARPVSLAGGMIAWAEAGQPIER